MPVEKKKVNTTKKSLRKPKKSMKRAISRKISKRTISDASRTLSKEKSLSRGGRSTKTVRRVTRRVGSPSPDRMKKYQTAYDSALKKAVEKSRRPNRAPPTDKESVKKKVLSKKSVNPATKTRTKSEYQIFVQKSMQLPEIKAKSVSERMSAIAAMWRNRK